MCKVIYLRRLRRYILSKVLSTKCFALMPKGYTLGLIVKTFVFHLSFRCIIIQRSTKIYTKPENSLIDEYSSLKQVIAPTA